LRKIEGIDRIIENKEKEKIFEIIIYFVPIKL